MILKIARYRENRDWWIMDGIRRINYGLEEVHYKDIREVPDVSISDFADRRTTRAESDTDRIMCATCRMDNGDEKYVEFDTIAYLCSDDGKTIEKLVANYDIPKVNGSAFGVCEIGSAG